MNTWLWIGGGVAALAGVVALLYFAGLGAVVKIIGAILGGIADAAQWLRAWLRKPGNKTRGVCLVLAFMAVSLGMQSWQRGTVIVQQRADYTALEERVALERAALQTELEARAETISQFVALAARQKALLAQARLQSAVALEEARKAREQAMESETKYQDAFMKRPPECKAALEVMAAACPSLSGY